MAQKLKNIDNKINPMVIEVLSPQQKNGFDCGIYALLYIKKIIEKIRKGTSPNRYENNEINSKDAEELRRNLYRQIAYELKDEENNGNKAKNTGKSNSESHKNVKTQKYSKIIDENDKNKKILEDKKSKTKIHSKDFDDKDKSKEKLDECWYFTNSQCLYSEDCNYIHKATCTEFRKTGRCDKEDCDLGHPVICKWLQSNRGCKLRGCNYFHPDATRNSQNVRHGNNFYKDPRNLRFHNSQNGGYGNNYYKNPRNFRPRAYQSGRHGNNYYKNPRNFRYSRSSRFNNNRTPIYNFRRPSYRPNDQQTYPNDIKISDTSNGNKPFLGNQISQKDLEVIKALGRMVNSQKD